MKPSVTKDNTVVKKQKVLGMWIGVPSTNCAARMACRFNSRGYCTQRQKWVLNFVIFVRVSNAAEPNMKGMSYPAHWNASPVCVQFIDRDVCLTLTKTWRIADGNSFRLLFGMYPIWNPAGQRLFPTFAWFVSVPSGECLDPFYPLRFQFGIYCPSVFLCHV
jgi:hypothetical protein